MTYSFIINFSNMTNQFDIIHSQKKFLCSQPLHRSHHYLYPSTSSYFIFFHTRIRDGILSTEEIYYAPWVSNDSLQCNKYTSLQLIDKIVKILKFSVGTYLLNAYFMFLCYFFSSRTLIRYYSVTLVSTMELLCFIVAIKISRNFAPRS